jgi:hypothetical protein
MQEFGVDKSSQAPALAQYCYEAWPFIVVRRL